MKLLIDTCWTAFEGGPEELDWLTGYLSREVTDFDSGVTGWQSVIDNGRFPTGLARIVARAAKARGFSVQLGHYAGDGLRPLPTDPAPVADWGCLLPDSRGYQREAVERGGAARRGLLKLPTGAGKTRVCVNFGQVYGTVTWLYVVHRGDVVRQVAEQYAKLTGERAGEVTAERWDRGTSNFSVATFSQLHALHKRAQAGDAAAQALAEHVYAEVEGLLVDECHATAAPTHFAALQRLRTTAFRIGVSGTPLHRGELENLHILGALGPLVYEVSRETLEEAGHIAKANVKLVEADGPGNWPQGSWNWRAVYVRGIVSNPRRNVTIAKVVVAARKPAMVFVEEIRHGRNLMPLLVGLRADFVWGKDSLTARKAALEALGRGDLDVLVCNDIFREGVDVPEIQTVVNAAGKKAPVALLQRLGRALRAKDAGENFDRENTCDVVDFWDDCHPWLEKHSTERAAVYEGEGFVVERVRLDQ